MQKAPSGTVSVNVDTPAPAYHWALLERELLRAQARACQVYYQKYFDERGYLRCVPRWGGNDGPDDAAENQLNWTMLHALGADDVVLDLFRQGWEGHLRQYTEARTIEVPAGREGMYYKEFPAQFDWFHHGESLSAFFLHGLSEPENPDLRVRMKRYAGLYMGEDPQAPNWDPEHRLIRSMMNGSRGPLLRKATALDWAGDPIEVEGRFSPLHGERNFREMLAHYEDYNDVVGDNPLNLGATALSLTAYALTGESKYRDWTLDYVNAWAERTAANGGLIPSNIGLDGTVGGACEGKWWRGVYGWGFSVIVPQTGAVAHRPSAYRRCFYGFGNALLLTGDQRYVDVWRPVIDIVNSNAKTVDGETLYPRCYGDEGWYNYVPEPFDAGAMEVYYWSMDEADRERVAGDPWVAFLSGEKPAYAVEALTEALATVRRKMDEVAADTTSPDTRMSDDMNHTNPATTEALTQLMLGGLPTGRVGYPLHCRVRYFDPARRRAGLPEDVAALVEGMTADETTLNLVNLNPVAARTVIVQGGAYAEHTIDSVADGERETAVGAPSVAVRLAPGCGTRLTLRMARYANQPTLAMPWV